MISHVLVALLAAAKPGGALAFLATDRTGESLAWLGVIHLLFEVGPIIGGMGLTLKVNGQPLLAAC